MGIRHVLRAVGVLAAVVVAGGAGAVPAAAEVPAAEVAFTSHGVRLHGSVLATPPDGRRHPAMVIVDGSGTHTRDDHRAEAQTFARAGIVTLVYDKRTVGYSIAHRDYGVLADDALAAVSVLAARPDVDPARIGLWGLSEGTWVSELAAARSRRVAFLVLVGAAGMAPVRQQSWSTGAELRHAGIAGPVRDAVAMTFTRLVADVGLFPEARFDPVPVLRRVHQPVLALWGALDRSSPPAESSRALAAALRSGGNTRYAARFFPGAQHDLHPSTTGFDAARDSYAAGYPQLVTGWVTDPTAGPGRPDLAAVPRQEQATRPVAPLRGWESAPVQAAVTALMLIGFAGYPLTALVRRLRQRRDRPVGYRGARVLAAAGPVAVLGLPAFLLYASDPDTALSPLLAGRPLAWLVLEALVLAGVAATVGTAVVRWRGVGPAAVLSGRFAPLLVAGALLVPWAIYWGLLTP